MHKKTGTNLSCDAWDAVEPDPLVPVDRVEVVSVVLFHGPAGVLDVVADLEEARTVRFLVSVVDCLVGVMYMYST